MKLLVKGSVIPQATIPVRLLDPTTFEDACENLRINLCPEVREAFRRALGPDYTFEPYEIRLGLPSVSMLFPSSDFLGIRQESIESVISRRSHPVEADELRKLIRSCENNDHLLRDRLGTLLDGSFDGDKKSCSPETRSYTREDVYTAITAHRARPLTDLEAANTIISMQFPETFSGEPHAIPESYLWWRFCMVPLRVGSSTRFLSVGRDGMAKLVRNNRFELPSNCRLSGRERFVCACED
jgi:hypothetical protein